MSARAVIGGVNEWKSGKIPLLEKVGWLRHKPNIAKPPDCRRRGGQTGEIIRSLVARYGGTVLDFITRKYGMSWPDAGYPVHLAAYSNFGGACSTYGNLLVVATNSSAGTHGLLGLETVFHEAMHQWDDDIERELSGHAPPGKTVPPLLSHAMIFFTAGEAIRRVAAEHVPYAEQFNLWQGRIGPFRPALDEIWKPYVDGSGTRDGALQALVVRTALPPR